MTRRDDPMGKRALFETPPVQPEDRVSDDPLVDAPAPEGRQALFSVGPHRPGTAVIDCSNCGVRSRVSIIEAAVRIMAISLWIPGLSYNRWLQCPNCQQRTWCRIHWWR